LRVHQPCRLTRVRAYYEVHKDHLADNVELPPGKRAAIEAVQRGSAAVRSAEAAIVVQHQAELFVAALDVASDASLHLGHGHRIVAVKLCALAALGASAKAKIGTAMPASRDFAHLR
jgi:hypothetical protein